MENETLEQENSESKKYTIPAAIIIAGALIAGALYLTNKPAAPLAGTGTNLPGVPEVTSEDHILGNPNARIVIVEYSDFECPFCKDFHLTMHSIIDEYGASGDVAWVYRHFAIPQLHSKAPKEAEATECAAELGGNQGVWDYADRLFEVTPSNNGLNLSQLSTIASDVGLNSTAFQQCLDSGKYAEKVQRQFDEVRASGGRGTPHNVVFIDGEQAVIEGAQPLAAMQRVIQTLLNDSSAQTVPVVPTL